MSVNSSSIHLNAVYNLINSVPPAKLKGDNTTRQKIDEMTRQHFAAIQEEISNLSPLEASEVACTLAKVETLSQEDLAGGDNDSPLSKLLAKAKVASKIAIAEQDEVEQIATELDVPLLEGSPKSQLLQLLSHPHAVAAVNECSRFARPLGELMNRLGPNDIQGQEDLEALRPLASQLRNMGVFEEPAMQSGKFESSWLPAGEKHNLLLLLESPVAASLFFHGGVHDLSQDFPPSFLLEKGESLWSLIHSRDAATENIPLEQLPELCMDLDFLASENLGIACAQRLLENLESFDLEGDSGVQLQTILSRPLFLSSDFKGVFPGDGLKILFELLERTSEGRFQEISSNTIQVLKEQGDNMTLSPDREIRLEVFNHPSHNWEHIAWDPDSLDLFLEEVGSQLSSVLLEPMPASQKRGQGDPMGLVSLLVQHCPNLRSLELRRLCGREEDLPVLQGLKFLESLKIGHSYFYSGAVLKLAELPKLKHLALPWAHNVYRNEGVGEFFELLQNHCGHLESLELEMGNPRSGHVLKSLGSMKQLKKLDLTNLRFWDSSEEDRNEWLEAVGKLTDLEDLNLNGSNGWSGEGLHRLRNLSQLKHLSLSEKRALHEEVTDASLETLASFPHLKTLNLWNDDKITDAGLVHLESLQELEQLDLGYCKQVTDASAKSLAKLKNLKSLNLSGTGVTTKLLCECLPLLPNLRTLRIYQTGVTLNDVPQELLEQLDELDARFLEGSEARVEELKKCIPVIYC